MAKAEGGDKRQCPGERYEVSVAICRARQANRYPKCLLCPHQSAPTGEGRAGDPKIKDAIFRTTCIAGRVPSEINEYVMRKIGTAAAQFLRAESRHVTSIVVGCDLRENSRSLGRLFCDGANIGGLRTVNIGAAPPEVLRFTLASRKLGAAAFISACQAAENVNGVRLYRHNGVPLTYESGLDKVGIIARQIKPVGTRAPGQRETMSPMEAYRSYVLKFASRLEPFKIVVDASSGVAGVVVPYVFEKLPVRVVGTHWGADGRSKLLGQHFPPPEVQQALRSGVIENEARLGMAVDFDGDLAVFCDERGDLLRSDVAAALIAREVLARTPGARVAYDLRFSGAMREEVLRAGGQDLRCRVDPLQLAQAMRQNEAIYGADAMGRHFFRDMFGSESPVLALLMMCSALSRSPEPVSKLAAGICRYSHSGELTYELPSDEAAEEVMEAVRHAFREANQDSLDGLTCRLQSWWFNVRHLSGSSSVRVNVEGRTPAHERRGRYMLEQIIQRHQEKSVT